MDTDLDIFKKALSLGDLEKAMSGFDQVDCPLTHNFADGVYVRELLIPKGTLIMGKRHRFETCNIVLRGDISIYMGPGQPVKRLKAPCIFNSQPGIKKLGFTHEDTIFLNVHPTRERDLEKIEEQFIIPEEEYIKSLEGGQK